MAKMRIEPKDRPKVKVQCLRLLVTLKLDPARMHLISGFVDTYLRLDQREEQKFQQELDIIEPAAKEEAMQIVTSWMEQGITQGLQQGLQQGITQGLQQGLQEGLQQGITQGLQQGLQEGRQEGLQQGLEREANLLVRQLQRRFNPLPAFLVPVIRGLDIDQLETLGEAFLDFESIHDLVGWLILSPPVKQRGTMAVQLLEGGLGDLPEGVREQVLGLKRGMLKKLGQGLLEFESLDGLVDWLAELG